MRLRREEIGRICTRILRDLIARGYIRTEKEQEVAFLLAEAFRENLAAEDRLNEEAYKILRAHAGDLGKGDIRHHEMFRLIKQKLARNRKFPL